ncbi:MAG: phage tail protein [Moraxella sp.]|nr:phage tail protein [Moraxella sp.]
MNKLSHIHGSKKGSKQPSRPHIAPDDLVSTSVAKILYGLAEGEISGLADGGKSIKLDGTPLINDNGQPNFTGINWDFRAGTLDQTHIAGFPVVENETNVGVELRHDKPFVKAISNRELSAVRVRLNFNALREQDADGNIKGYAIEYAIDVQTDGGSFQEVLRQTVRGKSSQGYKKSHRIDLPNAGTAKRWTIRVRRITPNRNSELVGDTVHIDALTEIIDAKLAYPCTALLGLSYDAKTFANIAKLAVRLKGKIIQVPSNYNAQTRQYHGLWDGTFKLAYSNNPAWVYYDLCTHKRYGLGERLAGTVDKWRLYQIGQYCDELVGDGKGGQEPRFTCNVYIQKADDAYRVLQNLASVFRGLSFWDGSNIVVDADTPKEPVYTFSAANIVGGEFTYTGTRARDRHTLAKVAWDNPENGFNTEYELIPDEQAIAKYGVRTLDINAFGCTSQGQAQRAGLWALKAEQLETQTVSFKTGLMGFIPQVGQVINIADNVFAGRAVSGKIMAVSGNKRQMTLDRTAGKVGDMLTVNGATGVQSAKISAVHGQVLTIDKPINAENEHIWAVISDDLKLKQFRILTIAQNDDATFDITALEYNAQKYDVVDNGAVVTPQPFTVLNTAPITAPNGVTLTANTRTHQGQAVTTMTINWEQVTGAVAYIVEWRKDDGNWQTLPKVSGQSVDIDSVYQGQYIARVRAVDSFDNESLATASQLTSIAGKIGKPTKLAKLTAQGKLFAMDLNWAFGAKSDDTNFTQIQVSPDGRSNIATLGTFAYPTNKHEITGLQGGLTQFYRGRIVDKLGNTSDWTAWVRGTTDNQAEKVLNLIGGQISENHLHQSLITPIAKIGTLETAVNAVNAQLPTLNGQIATLNSKTTSLQNELNTAKNTLQTAVGNITTERNRITTTIRDITALQTANNAKTQELASLTQTVNGHTSQVRELAVTTGDLTQKYSQLKTASDTANAEITAIKQTQSGQATSIERLGARFDNLAVGGRNLILGSGVVVQNGSYPTKSYPLAPNHGLAHGDDVVITVWGELAGTKTAFYAYNSGGAVQIGKLDKIADGVYQLKTTWKLTSGTNRANNTALNIYPFNRNQAGTSRIDKIKLERGNIATDWTEAPEDVQSGLDSKASTASLDEFKRTQATKDNATAQKLSQIETAYKQADTQANTKIDNETTARTNADTALGQRIDTLQADYNGNKSAVANQIKTLTDKDTATATQISQLSANVKTAQNTANTANTKADTATAKADNAQRTANDAVSRANTANSAITAEQKARADADSSLASRISALDSAYKKSDTDITARIAREETARATGDNANTQALRVLESTVNGISGRVGTSESKIASLERTTSDTNQALATAQSQMNARFDSLSVGGRNLLLATNKMTDTRLWRFGKHASQTQAQLPRQDDELTLKSATAFWCHYLQRSQENPNLANLHAGQTYTLSFEAHASVAVANFIRCFVRQYFTGGSNNTTRLITPTRANEWIKYQHTFSLQARHANHTSWAVIFEIIAVGELKVRNIKLEHGNIATDWTEAPEDLQVDLSPYATNSSLNEFKQAQATQTQATVGKLAQLESTLGTKANTTALNSLTTKVNQVDGKLTAESQKLSTLQTTVQGQTASIQQHAQSLNGLSAQWTLKVQSGNIVSGIGLASSGGISDFAVRADKFYIAPPTGTNKGASPFVVLTAPQTVGGVTVPAGTYMNSAFIQNGSISSAKLANASITTAKIANASIDTAKIKNGSVGSLQLQDGAVTTAKIGALQVDTLQIKDNAVTVPRTQFSANAQSFYSIDTQEEINRISMDAQGGMVAISFGFERLTAKINRAGSNPTIYLRIKRGDTVLRTITLTPFNKPTRVNQITTPAQRNNDYPTTTFSLGYDFAFDYSFVSLPTITDNPPKGTHVYTVTLESRGLNAGKNSSQRADSPVTIAARSLQILGIKR